MSGSRKQIFGLITKKVQVASYLVNKQIITEVTDDKTILQVTYDGLQRQDWQTGNYVEPIQNHLRSVNAHLTAIDANLQVELANFLACIIHQAVLTQQ